jgi:hypothetical protein
LPADSPILILIAVIGQRMETPHIRLKMADRKPQAGEATTIFERLPVVYTLLTTISIVIASLCFFQEVFRNPYPLTLSSREPWDQLCMNALDFYSVLLEWVWNHVTEWNMYLIQSATTACALSWYAMACVVSIQSLTDLQASVSSLADVMEASPGIDQYSWCRSP